MSNPQAPAVGATIWRFDENRRIYPPVPPGKWSSGPPIYREHWRPVEITGETSRSWLTYRGKCPKNGPHPGWALSASEVDDDCWVRDHRRHVVRLLERCGDPALIRQVAELLGYRGESKA